jgi:hypothetical protein
MVAKKPWFWITLGLILIIVLAVLLPMLSRAKYRIYQPPRGFIAVASPVPQSLIGTNGWIDPSRIDSVARMAFQGCFGPPDDPPKKTDWEDSTLGEGKYSVWEGELVCNAIKLNQKLIEHIPDINFDGLTKDSIVSVRLQYWTDKWANATPPGSFSIALDVRIGPAATGRPLKDPRVLRILSQTVIEEMSHPQQTKSQ